MEREEILSFPLIHKKSFRGKIWISERVFFVFCRKESTGRLMSFFIDSPDSHRLITPGCRASTLETGGLFSTMFAVIMFVIQVDSSFESMVRNDLTVLELVIRFALVPVDFRYQKIIASGFRPVEKGEGPLCRVSLLS
ncbi:hypothetical protein Bca4012_072011 [Brassica carinata]